MINVEDIPDLDNKFSEYITRSADLNEFINEFMESITLACNQAIPRKGTGNSKKRSVPWWSRNISEMRKKVNHTRRKYQRTYKNVELREQRKKEYHQLKAQYKEMIVKAKFESWKEYCNATNRSQPWNYIYKAAAGKLKCQTNYTNLLKQDGTYTKSMSETINILMDKYVPVDDCRSDNEYNKLVRDKAKSSINTGNDCPFTEQEVENAISSFNPRKAPGGDGHTQRIVYQVYAIFPKSIAVMYNECLRRGTFPSLWKHANIISIVKPGKENAITVDKYRPISLLSLWGKILEKLFVNRIMFHLHRNDYLSERQFGFTPQKSTLNALMEVKAYIDEGLANKDIILLIALDVKGAFDAAWWPAILAQLRDFKCPKNLQLLTDDYFSNRSATIMTSTVTVTRTITQGCAQGSCGGPKFWIVQCDSLLKEDFPSGTLVIGFADDILIAVRGGTVAEVECLGNHCLRLVDNWSSKNKVIFNSEKSKVMPITRKLSAASFSLFLRDQELEVVKEMKYLGVVFDEKYLWNNHVKMITEKSIKLTNILSRSAKVYWGMRSEALQIIYKGALVPLLTYAIPVWQKALQKKYNAIKYSRVQRLFLLRIIKGFRTISHEAACIISNEEPILIKAREIARMQLMCNGFIDEWGVQLEKAVQPSNWMHPAHVQKESNMVKESEALVIYTDGSRLDDKVGCAFVAYTGNRQIAEARYKLECHCSNNQAEQLAILEALKWLLNLYANNSWYRTIRDVVVKTDSQVALHCLRNRNNHMPIVEQVRRIWSELRCKFGIDIALSWVKAHVGEEGNEAADRLAKQASQDLNLPISYSSAPRSYIKRRLAADTMLQWEHDWSSSYKGRHVRDYFPTVRSRRRSPIKITYKLTQVLTGHGKNRAYLNRFHIIESAVCPCDNSTVQSWDHILFECRNFEHERATFLRSVVTSGYIWPPNKSDTVQSDLVDLFLRFVEVLDLDRL